MDVELKQYLQRVNFSKQYEKLIKKLRNKSVIIYGCGQLFQTINQMYDLKKINIIGVSDLKFTSKDNGKEFLGYKIITKKDLSKLQPDYILVATLNYVDVIKNFETNIKLKPLVKRSLFKVLREIWCK